MIEIKRLSRHYKTKSGTVKALDNLDLQLESTGMVFILGKSGSGKSTLLNVMGGLDKYDSGEIIIKGKSSKDFSQSDFDSLRNTFVGFIFQDYNILQEFTVAQNIGLALELQGKKATNAAINNIIEQVDMQGYANRKPATLSGGQKQRVAIARALIKEPEIIMADEPTGALDSNTGKQVFETLKNLSKNKLVLVVSHDRENAEHYGDRVIELMDGQIISDIKKYLAPPQQESSGVNIVDNKIVTIKAGYTLTADDTRKLNKFLHSAKEGIVISTDSTSNQKFKKLARIDDSGNKESFSDTNRQPLNIQQYDPKQFKLIRSKLPWKDSFKIGASGLKVKPVRLIFTILLCVVAFTLFGLADTMASYNKIQAAISSIEQGGINFASLNKKTFYPYEQDSDRGHWSEEKMRQADVDKLNNDLEGANFKSVYLLGDRWEQDIGFANNIHTRSELGSSAYGSFYKSAFSGAVELSDTELADLGFDLMAGRMPRANDEIVVTKYAYEHFNLGGYKEDINANSTTSNMVAIPNADALLNKTITINAQNKQQKYKIVGVVDTHLDSSRYEIFKQTESGNIFDYLLAMEFDSLMKYSFHAMMFTNVGLFEALQQAKSVFLSIDYDAHFFGYLQTAKPTYDQNNGQLAYFNTMGKLENLDTDQIVWKNGQAQTALGKNEVILNMSVFNGRYANINGVDHQVFFEPYEIYSEISSHVNEAQYSFFDNLYKTNATFADLFPNMEYFVRYLMGMNTDVDPEQPQLKGLFEQQLFYYTEGSTVSGEEAALFARYPTVEEYELAFASIGGMSGYTQNYFDSRFCGQQFDGDFGNTWSFVERQRTTFDLLQFENSVFADLFPNSELYTRYILGSQFDYSLKEIYDHLQESEKNSAFLVKYPTYAAYLTALNAVGGASGFEANHFEPDVIGKDYYDDHVKLQTDLIFGDDQLTSMYLEYHIGYTHQNAANSDKISVVGIYFGEFESSLLVCSDNMNNLVQSMMGGDFVFAISKMPTDQNHVRALVEYSYAEQDGTMFSLNNQVTYSLQNINDLIETLADVFLYVGIGFAVFASLMMLNFIATSISYKKREIGILRAVGATGKDVFGIFLNESMLITLINFVISLVGTIVICIVLNVVLREQVGLMITLLDFGLRQVGLMLGISLLVALVSSFLPVNKISRMRPIDAIKQG